MNKRKSIIVYNTEGENKGLIVPPQGYIYSRFCNNSKLEVICEGDSLRADSFGRVDYKFEYNLFCNNWERKKRGILVLFIFSHEDQFRKLRTNLSFGCS